MVAVGCGSSEDGSATPGSESSRPANAASEIAGRPGFEKTAERHREVLRGLAGRIAATSGLTDWEFWQDTWTGCEVDGARRSAMSISFDGLVPDEHWDAAVAAVREVATDLGATRRLDLGRREVQFSSATGLALTLGSDVRTVVSLDSDCRFVEGHAPGAGR